MILYINMNEKLKEKFNTLRKVISFFYGRYTVWVLIRDILFLLITVAEMFNITVMGKFIDGTAQILRSGIGEFNLSEFVRSDSFFYLMMYLLLWVVIQIGNQIRTNIYENITEKVRADCNYDMVNKVSKANLQDIMNPEFENLTTYISTYSIDRLLSSYLGFSDIISQGARLLSAIFILFVDLRYSVFILILFVLPEVIASHIQRKKIRSYNSNKVQNVKLRNYLTNLALNNNFFSELRVDGTFKHIKGILKDENEDFQNGLFNVKKHFYIDKIATSIVDQVLKYLYLIYLISYSVVNKLTIGRFTALFNYTDVVYNSAFNMLDTIAIMSDRLSYADEFFRLMEWKGFGDLSHGTSKLPEGPLSLELMNLDFAYPDQPKVKVLENISLDIKPGEKVVFYGGDSSGKSSLVKILTGMYEIISGDYFIGGLSIRELQRGELKGRVAVLFQYFINYSFSLEENVTIGSERKNIDRKLFNKVLKITGLDKLLVREDINKDTILGRDLAEGIELSPGYWQRIAIARMLYRNKDIFIMDEPFTFIDSNSKSKMIEDIIDFVGDDRILIYITRSTEDLEKFDRVFYIDQGHLVEQGPWKELMSKKGKTYKKVKSSKRK
ncbi:MAG: ABC transporter permease [candidate division WS6 bacterium 34_10]|uniref:ABC transporter permease n=1 Tax=candidate division WS6 bacterium 34_10 TaxID=1641389 RepID=A0A101HGN2_9BACT|nr:MAG: ABC transporter permease [candidate division WS6 bacterium 34_10]